MELAMLFPLMLILLFLKGFFSGSEIALVSADKIKLRSKAERGNKGAAMVLKLFERPEALLTTTLVGTNITTVALVTMGASLMIELLGDKGDFYAVLLLTPLLLILGEIVPKSVYQQKSNDLAPVIVYPLRVFSMVFSPVIFVFSRVARLAALLAGIKRPERTVFVIREQLRTMVEMAEAVPSVGVFDRVRIKHALRFSETTVGEAMTPLAEVVAIERGRSTRDALKLLRRRGFSRLPVYEGNITNIVGIVSFTAWDLSDGSLPEQPLKKHMRPALFVPAQHQIEHLLPALSQRGDSMAVVVDEFGSAVGVITKEDILEEVVGDVSFGEPQDTYRRRAHVFKKLDEDVYLMDARLSISEANEILGTDLPSKEFHTLGGMLTSRLRHIPREGEYISEKGYRFTISEATERAVVNLRVEREGLSAGQDSD